MQLNSCRGSIRACSRNGAKQLQFPVIPFLITQTYPCLQVGYILLISSWLLEARVGNGVSLIHQLHTDLFNISPPPNTCVTYSAYDGVRCNRRPVAFNKPTNRMWSHLVFVCLCWCTPLLPGFRKLSWVLNTNSWHLLVRQHDKHEMLYSVILISLHGCKRLASWSAQNLLKFVKTC